MLSTQRSRLPKDMPDLAESMAQQEADGARALELREIARILNKVPYEPADSFYEALQSMWLVHLVLQLESNGHSLSYGRMDQYLYPYYQKDIAQGTLTDDHAVELLTNLWIKTLTINKIRSWSHTQFSAGSPLYQNVTIGGQTIDKKGCGKPAFVSDLKKCSTNEAAAAKSHGPLSCRLG